jgi:hypothetical protein
VEIGKEISERGKGEILGELGWFFCKRRVNASEVGFRGPDVSGCFYGVGLEIFVF